MPSPENSKSISVLLRRKHRVRRLPLLVLGSVSAVLAALFLWNWFSSDSAVPPIMSGVLRLRVDQADAHVVIDHWERGPTRDAGIPVDFLLAPGIHEVIIRKSGFQSVRMVVDVPEGMPRDLAVTLQAAIPETSSPVRADEAPLRRPGQDRSPEERWADELAQLSPAEQAQRVVARLRDLNPGYDGNFKYEETNGTITKITLKSIGVRDLTPLRGLPSLRNLACAGTREAPGDLESLAGLAGLPLVNLDCNYNGRVRTLEPLRGMKLTGLNCGQTAIDSLEPLRGMPLVALGCQGTQVTSLEPLRGMSLGTLAIWQTPIRDLAPLQNMPLVNLNLAETPVESLAGLRTSQLLVLDCSGSQVASLEPLQGTLLNELRCNLWNYPREIELFPTLAKFNGRPTGPLYEYAERWHDWNSQREDAGLIAEIYHDDEAKDVIQTRIDPWLGMCWSNTSPTHEMEPDPFAIRWTGRITAPSPGEYTLRVVADDLARLWIDRRLVGIAGLGGNSFRVTLTGEPQLLQALLVDRGNSAEMFLYWTPPGGQEELVPPTAFTHDPLAPQRAPRIRENP